MRFDILTLFPEFFISPLSASITGKAISKGILQVNTHNIRDYTTDKHHTADDYPYGGGHGMVMKVDPVVAALEAVSPDGVKPKVVLMTPQGLPLSPDLAKELSGAERLVVICGRYEGVDERVRQFVDLEVSTGDYVLTGGEIPALALIDAVSRFIPGVLGEPESAVHESFAEGLLEYPQYTRPEVFRGLRVPQVLVSGNHAEIEKWRRREAIKRTFKRRPDILEGAKLSAEEKRYLERLKNGEDT